MRSSIPTNLEDILSCESLYKLNTTEALSPLNSAVLEKGNKDKNKLKGKKK